MTRSTRGNSVSQASLTEDACPGNLTAGWLTMNRTLIGALLLAMCASEKAWGDGTVVFSGQKKQNNLVSELLEVTAVSKSGNSFAFTRPGEGWIFLAAAYKVV